MFVLNISLPFIIGILSVSINLILGLVVFVSNRKSSTNIIFGFLNLFLAFFTVANLIAVSPLGYSEKLMWLRFVMFSAVFMNTFLYLFVLVFPDTELNISLRKKITISFFTTFVGGVALTSWLFPSMTIPSGSFVPTPVPGPAVPIFGGYVITLTIASAWTLFRRFRDEKELVKKKQLQYILFGTGLMFGAFFIFNFFIVLAFGNTFFIDFTPLFISIFIIFSSYAILKHHLFDIKIIATELLVFALWIFILARTILSMTVEDQVVNGSLLSLMIITGIFLIRSVIKEVEQRERLAESAKALKESHEREMEKTRVEAKLRDEFVFIAAHELRTPITAIRGFLELVEDVQGTFPSDVQEDLDAIKMASGHLNELVNNLLEIARSDAGAMKVETKPIDIIPIIEGILKEVNSLAIEKNIQVNLNNFKNDIKVMADENKVKEVFTNLISNAIKYNREGGTLDVCAMCVDDQNIIIEVRDTGFGIPTDQQEKIFGKFFRATNKDTQGILGTGLGLFITKMLVEKMGGIISFSSIEGKGTTFAVSFPRV